MLVEHARVELEKAKLFEMDSDYGGETAKQVLALIEVFASQGHSGMSAMLTLELFGKLARFEHLTPLTSDPSEWVDRTDLNGGEPLWQSNRNPSAFSKDGGATWYFLADA